MFFSLSMAKLRLLLRVALLLNLAKVIVGEDGQSMAMPQSIVGETPPQEIVDLYSDPSLTVGEKWALIGQFYNDFAWPHRRKIIHYLGLALEEKQLKFSPKCAQSLSMLREGLEDGTLWAFEIMDSMAKMKPGFLSGEFADFGKWDQCIETNYHEKGVDFDGKFCLYEMHWPQPETDEEVKEIATAFNGSWLEDYEKMHRVFRVAPITNAICFPSVCDKEEIQTAVQFYLDEADVPIEFKFQAHCDLMSRYDEPYSTQPLWKRACGYTFLCLVALVLLATTVSHYLPDYLPGWLRVWDAKYNTDKIYHEVRDEDAKRLGFVNYFRINFLVCSTLTHICFSSGLTTPETHFGLFSYDASESSGIGQSLIAASSFLVSWNAVLGAFLAYYTWYPELVKRNGKLNFFTYVLGRFLRTTPVIAGTLLVILGFPPTWGAGPLFMKGYTNVTENCLKNWMAEIFYFNNQIEVQDSCLLHSWYLSTDIQLYIASFFIIIALYKKPKLGIMLCLLSIVGGIATQAYFINYYNTGMSWSLSSPDIFKTIRETRVLHFAVWNYISSYAIGLLLGFVITKKIEVNDSQFRLGWAIVFAIGSAAVYGHYMLLQEGASRNQEILVGATMRTAIAICGAWWFYNIWLDRIPLQSRIANASIWLYLGRINYSTFMLHFLFVWYNNFSLRATIEYRGFPIVMRLISELVISHFLGYLGYIIFEAPCLNITKALFTRKAAVVPKGDATDVNRNKEATAKKAN